MRSRSFITSKAELLELLVPNSSANIVDIYVATLASHAGDLTLATCT